MEKHTDTKTINMKNTNQQLAPNGKYWGYGGAEI